MDDTAAGILIIDDEIDVGIFFKRLLTARGYRVAVANNGLEAAKQLKNNSFKVALVDLKLPDTDGITLLSQIKSVQPYCEVIIMTGYGTTKTAVKAIQLGAFDYVEKPFDDIAGIEALISKALNFAQKLAGKEGRSDWDEIAEKVNFIVGESSNMIRLVSTAEKIARKDINVLIHGETGTGKEVLARFVHAASNRAEHPFIAVNCGALPENLLESELFGHEKGSFTGASTQRKGIFELADQGTLFLDEIGEASLSIQVKLLRVLETGEFLRVGGEKPVKTNVRVIAATNVDLEQAVSDKVFREDLFYRLDVVRLVLPPLRERKTDIKLLVNHFMKRKRCEGIMISPSAMELLESYNWPGNIRELANVVDQAIALCDNQIITSEHLSEKLISCRMVKGQVKDNVVRTNNDEDLIGTVRFPENIDFITPEKLSDLLERIREYEYKVLRLMEQKGVIKEFPFSMQAVEAQAIREALNFSKGNVSLAARALGIGRNTLYRKAREYKIDIN